MTGKSPIRSCVGCGKTADKGDLLRFSVGPEHAVIPDLNGKLPGRGAYLHPDITCFFNAQKKNGFRRAFRNNSLDFNAEKALSQVRYLLEKQVFNLIGLCRRAGLVVTGNRTVEYELRHQQLKGTPVLAFLATDSSPKRKETVRALCEGRDFPLRELWTQNYWGEVLGTTPRSFIMFLQGGQTSSLQKTLLIAERLGQ